MDLQKPYFAFKGKHAMLGFDPAGSMLYLGRSNDKDVFLAMAPNDFLRGRVKPCPPGHSSGSPVMSKCHYRQMMMMLAHFLAAVPQQEIFNVREVYKQDLDSSDPRFEQITNLLYVFPDFPSSISPPSPPSIAFSPFHSFTFPTVRSPRVTPPSSSTWRTSKTWTT